MGIGGLGGKAYGHGAQRALTVIFVPVNMARVECSRPTPIPLAPHAALPKRGAGCFFVGVSGCKPLKGDAFLGSGDGLRRSKLRGRMEPKRDENSREWSPL